MTRSPARILAVTVGLAAGGALFGALAGAVTMAILLVVFGEAATMFDTGFIPLAARIGAMLGAVLLPIAGWLLMRRVPLGRALTGTLMGTVTGGVLGAVFFTFLFGPIDGPVLGALLGFLWATISLRRRFPAARGQDGIQVPRGIGA